MSIKHFLNSALFCDMLPSYFASWWWISM